MKFLAGLVAGILLCIILAGVGGYYLLGRVAELEKDLRNNNVAVPSQSTADNNVNEDLRKALQGFNTARSPEEMLSNLDKIIALRPNESQAYAAKASLLMQKGDYAGAIRNFNKAISLNPNSADFYMARAEAHLLRGDYQSANKDLTAALAINPSLAGAYYNRGISNLNLNRIKPAFTDFSTARKLFASSGDKANYAQASKILNLIKNQGKNPAAAKAKIVKAAAELKPSSNASDTESTAKFKNELSRSLSQLSADLKNGDNKGMVEKFKQASAGLNSGGVDTSDFSSFIAKASQGTSAKAASAKKNTLDYVTDAKKKMASGNYDGAIEDLTKVIENSSNPSEFYAQRAAAHLQNKDYKSAYNDYSKAIETDKNNASAYMNRARLRSAMGDSKGAAQDALAAEELYKNQGNKEGALQAKNMANLAQGKGTQQRSERDSQAEALFKDASNAYLQGNYNESLRKFDALAERQPNVPEVYYNRAIANAAAGNKDAALKDYQKTISMNPNLPDAHIGAASVLMEQGRGSEATKYIDAALALNPELPAAYRMRGAQSMEQGNPAKATEDFSKAIELDSNDAASYFSRGLSYGQQNNLEQAKEDLATAGRLAAEQGNDALANEIAKYQGMIQQAEQQAQQAGAPGQAN